MNAQTISNLKKHDFGFLAELGEGGFGVVVKVRHEISGQEYAVKKLTRRAKADPENILREIRAIASLKNPNVIGYNYSFIEDDELYLVMEYCPMGSLRDLLRKEGKLEIGLCSDLFLRLTNTFAFLHDNGFIHHDIKPDNILFTEKKVKVSDFGTVNTVIGTIRYSAPEMLMPKAPMDDPRVDIFALGITFMECATGVNPLRSCETWEEHILAVKNAAFPISTLPYWMQQVLLKACHYDPSARFQTMHEFHEALLRRHIPQVIDENVIQAHQLAAKLKMHVVAKRWQAAKKLIDGFESEKAVAFLIQKGRYYLGTHQLALAKATFEEVLKIDRSAPIEKNMAEVFLQFNEPSKAAAMVHGYINKTFNDVEAHNQLLFSYFQSDQWELGLAQAAHLRKLFPHESVFVNNYILFELLLGREPEGIDAFKAKSPIVSYNYHDVVYEDGPAIYKPNDPKSLKSKLLFTEFKFRSFQRSRNVVTVEINGQEHHCDQPIISIGREGFPNTITISDSFVSRRHLVIVNLKNDVWLYDMSTLGTYVDGKRVATKSFLLGRCAIKAGGHTFYVKSDRGLLL